MLKVNLASKMAAKISFQFNLEFTVYTATKKVPLSKLTCFEVMYIILKWGMFAFNGDEDHCI